MIMKNILLFTAMLMVFYLPKAQVGINTRIPNSSSILDIYATNKGVTFPNIALLSSTNGTSPILNPKESLLVYNTNSALSGGKGYYYWNAGAWEFIFNDLNSYNLQNLTKYYSAINNTTYNFTAPGNFYGNANHNIGENITLNGPWTEITDLTKTIIIDRSLNEIIFTINGMIQANNSVSNGDILSTIGIFIDNILVDIKPFNLKLTTNCSFRSFTLYGLTKNVAPGSHTVKFAIRNRTSSQNITLAFGGRNMNSLCNNILSDDESKISAVILINQPFNF